MTTKGPPISRRAALQLAAVVAGGGLVSVVLRRTAPLGREIPSLEAAGAIVHGRSPTEGPAGASLRLAVFTDYRCPACRMSFPALHKAVRADGDVLIVYKEWPIFGPFSERAAKLALATAGQGLYARVHERLMTDLKAVSDLTALQEAMIAEGVNWPELERHVIAHGPEIDAEIRQNGLGALAVGLSGTPGYLAGSTLVTGALDAGELARLFRETRTN